MNVSLLLLQRLVCVDDLVVVIIVLDVSTPFSAKPLSGRLPLGPLLTARRVAHLQHILLSLNSTMIVAANIGTVIIIITINTLIY